MNIYEYFLLFFYIFFPLQNNLVMKTINSFEIIMYSNNQIWITYLQTKLRKKTLKHGKHIKVLLQITKFVVHIEVWHYT